MDINVQILFNARENLYRIEAKEEDSKKPIHISRWFQSYGEAKVAEGILHLMFEACKEAKEFDYGMWDFNVRATLRLLDAPNKW